MSSFFYSGYIQNGKENSFIFRIGFFPNNLLFISIKLHFECLILVERTKYNVFIFFVKDFHQLILIINIYTSNLLPKGISSKRREEKFFLHSFCSNILHIDLFDHSNTNIYNIALYLFQFQSFFVIDAIRKIQDHN